MVSREQSVEEQLAAMSFVQREGWWRKRYIEQGISWGMPKTLDWVRDAEEEEENDAVPDQVSNSRVAEESNNAYVDGDWLAELDQAYPADARFFRQLEDYFPEGYHWVQIVDPASRSGAQFFRRLKSEFPEAWEFFLADVE